MKRMGSLGRVGLAMVVAVAWGCNSLDEPPEDGPVLHIPTDDRPAVQSGVAPVPIAGGTLHVTATGAHAIVSDEDRDQVVIVDLADRRVAHTLTLAPGDRPGRIVDGLAGTVHVVLRGAGELVTLDPIAGQVRARVSVCRAPRGLALDEATGEVAVACADGRLVTLDAETGAVSRDLAVGGDLRDVLVRGGELWATRFKSAELVRVDATGAVIAADRLPGATVPFVESEPLESDGLAQPAAVRMMNMSATVAWRAVTMADGGAVVVHQESADDEIELGGPTPSGSAYGGAGFDLCSGILRTAVSVVGPDGAVAERDIVGGALLPVDVAAHGGWIAIASAGVKDSGAPLPTVVFPADEGSASGGIAASDAMFGGVLLLRVSSLAPADVPDPCAFPEASADIPVPAVAVAFDPEGRLLAQTREPAALWVRETSGELRAIELPGDARLDTGHDIFHRDAGGGIACASCHPEGAEDGHVWHFAGIGARRTQALHVGLETTAPFHWDGDLSDVGDLLEEVFVGRMGGVRQSAERLGVLEDWVFSIERPPAMREANDPAVRRGEALFHSSVAGCAGCHSGDSLTNNESHAVGTLPGGARLQVPSLVAIGYRAPFMHDGCAATLADRFDPACGGDAHGDVSRLSEGEVADLVAYLESL